jgi:hypothetical protein
LSTIKYGSYPERDWCHSCWYQPWKFFKKNIVREVICVTMGIKRGC